MPSKHINSIYVRHTLHALVPPGASRSMNSSALSWSGRCLLRSWRLSWQRRWEKAGTKSRRWSGEKQNRTDPGFAHGIAGVLERAYRPTACIMVDGTWDLLMSNLRVCAYLSHRKDAGNELYKKGDYRGAIDAYGKVRLNGRLHSTEIQSPSWDALGLWFDAKLSYIAGN
jgi:hypothetical protein